MASRFGLPAAVKQKFRPSCSGPLRNLEQHASNVMRAATAAIEVASKGAAGTCPVRDKHKPDRRAPYLARDGLSRSDQRSA